jgi:uncharacterized membrane protein
MKRFWEIDFLRGIAVIMMIVFHFMFDLNYFSLYSFELWSGFWLIFERITALIFIFLVGISLTLSYAKHPSAIRFVKRGLKIFCCGLLITIATALFLNQGTIFFGVLHFIGTAVILAYPFVKYTYRNIAIGTVLVVIGLYLSTLLFDFPWLMWLGLAPSNFYTLDYFPLLPWFGVVLLGVFVGNKLYKNHKRIFKISEATNPLARSLCFIGRHSLLIYLLHQPMLIGIILLI